MNKSPTSWSRDGKILLYHANNPASKSWDLGALPLTPERTGAPLKPFPVLQTPFDEIFPHFSPDGRWIAYVSNESQRNELYVTAFPVPAAGPGARRQVSRAGINPTSVRWRSDGKEIFCVGLDGNLMVAEVTARGNTIDVGAVRPLFRFIGGSSGYTRYDVSSDGQHFLVAVPPEQKSSQPVTLITNWPAALKK